MKEVTPEQISQILNQVEEFFKSQEDPAQVPVVRESFDKLLYLDEGDIVIRTEENGDLIGSLAVFPTTKTLAEKFLKGEITEKELFNATEKMEHPEALYLLSCIIAPPYRRQGYALSMTREIAEYFLEKNKDIFVFAWPYTPEGLSLIRAIESGCGLPVHVPSTPTI
jgi:hypothetical protein